jgi:hypothetical protein
MKNARTLAEMNEDLMSHGLFFFCCCREIDARRRWDFCY